MTRFASLLLIGLLIGGLLSGASTRADSTMPPGAFLRNPVSDVNALSRELREDSVAVSRYSHKLRLSPATVRANFAHLHLTRLQRDIIMEVCYVHPGERIGVKVRRVRKGTVVFSLPNGTPVLAQVCGNPLHKLAGINKRGKRSIVSPFTKKRRRAKSADIPDFDPSEPLDPPSILAADAIAARAAIPSVLILPGAESTLFNGLGQPSTVTPEPAGFLLAVTLAAGMLGGLRPRHRNVR